MNVTNQNRPNSVRAVLDGIDRHHILDQSQFIDLFSPIDGETMGLCVGHFAFQQSKTNWPIKISKKYKDDYINIALYHGAVDLYKTDLG